MTVAAAWVRHFGQSEELVFVADSRLRWAGAWDSCPKLFPLPRTDAAMAFAGDTMWAYPIVAQTQNQIAAYGPSVTRQNDLLYAKGHALRVINSMIQTGDAVSGPDGPDTTADFLFGGFSALESGFRLWRLTFDPGIRRYIAERIKPGYFGQCCFIGDVAAEADSRLKDLLRSRPEKPKRHQLGIEPLEIIRDLLREGDRPTIGGPAQLLKIYRHMHTEPFVVKWRQSVDDPAIRTLLGRTLLEYEDLDAPVVDIDNPFGPPPPGPGAQLQRWDEELLSIAREVGGVDCASLAAAAKTKGLDIGEQEVTEWLSYSEYRGLLEHKYGSELLVPVLDRLP
jgi:hypothetical protein